MFGIGMPEMILILGLALIVVGPDKLPGLARSLAKGILELKNTAETLKDNITSESPVLKEIQPELEEAAKSIKGHLLDSDEEETNKEEIKTGIYDPLDDDDYDNDGADDIGIEIKEDQDNSEDDLVVEEGVNKQAATEMNNETQTDDKSAAKTTGKKITVHSTVKQDLNKETKS